ncbi:MAG: GtrA family protein [Rhizobiales bacterium]|nr:GtrA family protein [Hyphomicrobiales bacterium]
MAISAIAEERKPLGRAPVWARDLGLSFLIAACVFASYAAAGFPTLANPEGDNDSMLRLVEVRDLLAGQGWYDLHQYRMGPPGGFVMHWSRFIDAPIALLVLIASAFGAGPALAEEIALTAWPFILMGLTLFALVRLARTLGRESVVFPAVVLGTGALYFLGIFRPGSIDHHNAQLALTVGMLVCLIRAPAARIYSVSAGLCAAVMLAIGMETAPYVAIAGGAVSVAFLWRGEEEALRATDFGLSFAAWSAAAFFATVGPSAWLTPACDAMSNVQLSLAVVGGLGLALAARLRATSTSVPRRLAGLLAVGVAVAATMRLAFPQCLGDPYAGVDPLLRELWLNYVLEAQSIVAFAKSDWTSILAYHATPMLALAVLAVRIWRGDTGRPILFLGGFLLAAFLVSCWQVRGASFAIPLATTSLALGVSMLREKAADRATAGNSIALVLGWLLSVNIVWATIGHQIRINVLPQDVDVAEGGDDACSAAASFPHLAQLPAGTVMAVSDLGSPVLAYTPHRAFAGHYNRNIAGNLTMVKAMLAAPDEAGRILRGAGADYLVLCDGNAENANLSTHAPSGLMAALLAGRIPAWLEADPASQGQVLKIYRVHAAAAP